MTSSGGGAAGRVRLQTARGPNREKGQGGDGRWSGSLPDLKLSCGSRLRRDADRRLEHRSRRLEAPPYQATDTKLNRQQVALKILPEAFATDPDRLARFQKSSTRPCTQRRRKRRIVSPRRLNR